MTRTKSSKLASLRSAVEKKGFITEMNDPTDWVSTGNYALNYRLTGRFDVGICNKRSTLLWGESGTGKTFLSSNLCANIQAAGYQIIYIDSEDSISEDYMEKIGIDLDEDMFLPIQVTTIEELEDITSTIFKQYDETDKFCLVIDSLAGLLTESQEDNYNKGKSKGDQGQFAKKLKLAVKNINKKIAQYDAYCLMVTHAYQNQDLLNGEGKWICSGGKGFQFFPSFSLLLEKAKLKDTDDSSYDPTKALKGVRIKATVTKTRFTAPQQKCELKVPYEVGLNPYDGVMEILKEDNIISQAGSWYSYILDGEERKFQAKNLPQHFEAICEMMEKNNQISKLEEAEEPEDGSDE